MPDHYRSPQGKQQFNGFVKILAVPMVPSGYKNEMRPESPYPNVGKIYPVLKVLRDGTVVGNLLTMIAFSVPYGTWRGEHEHEFCLRTTNPDGSSDYGGYQYQFVREDGTPLPIEHQHRPWWRRIFR